MSDVIILDHLTKRFGETVVLRDVSFRINEGSIVGVVGRNGSGKTILLKMICGLMLPSSGSVTVHGQRIGVDRDFAADTGVLIETPEFLPTQTGFQCLHSLSVITGKKKKEDLKKLLMLVGLDPESKKPVGKYSLGMRQRLGIAQAILDDPSLLLLDEPMNGLDKHGVQDMRRLLSNLRDSGKTIVLASHIAEDIELLCDRVYEVDGGIVTRREKKR